MHKHKLGPNSAVTKLPEIQITDKDAKTYKFDIYLVDIARVYKEGIEDKPLICESTAKDMLHTAVGLLSINLVSMDRATIYEALFEKSSVTLFFMSKDNDCTDRLVATNTRKPNDAKKNKNDSEKLVTRLREAIVNSNNKNSNEGDAYESGAEEASDFELVFASDISSDEENCEEEQEEEEAEASDKQDKCGSESSEPESSGTTESGTTCSEETSECDEDEEEEDDDTVNKCSQGYHAFITSCLERKLKVKELFSGASGEGLTSEALSTLLGPENRIAAVCNFRARKVESKKRVIHITFLSVRKHLRRLGIGTRIIDIIKTRQMSGVYDAIVVHADLNATEFFERNGFSGDALLNKQWSSFAGEYVNCLLMTYFPPMSFGPQTVSNSKLLQAIDKSVEDWLNETGRVHQMQYTLCKRLRAEVVRLQNQVLSQDSLIQVLKREVLKQAHAIESLRERLRKCQCGVGKAADSVEGFVLTMLPSTMDPETQRTIDFNETVFRECAGDED